MAWSHPGLTVWRTEAARALVRLGEQEESSRLASEQLELARATQLPRPIAAAALTAGMVATPRPSLRLLREAVDLLERTQAKLELARPLVELGAALRREGNASRPEKGCAVASSSPTAPARARSPSTRAGSSSLPAPVPDGPSSPGWTP